MQKQLILLKTLLLSNYNGSFYIDEELYLMTNKRHVIRMRDSHELDIIEIINLENKICEYECQ